MFNYLPLEEKKNLLHSFSNVIASVRKFFGVKTSITCSHTCTEEVIYLCLIIQENVLYCVWKGDKNSQNTWNGFAVPLSQDGTIPIFLIFGTTEVLTKKSAFAACAFASWHGWSVCNRKVSDTWKSSSARPQMKSFLFSCLPEKYYDQGKFELCMFQTIRILFSNKSLAPEHRYKQAMQLREVMWKQPRQNCTLNT